MRKLRNIFPNEHVTNDRNCKGYWRTSYELAMRKAIKRASASNIYGWAKQVCLCTLAAVGTGVGGLS